MNDWRQRAQRLRALDLVAVLRTCDAQPDRHDAHKWHTRRGVLSVSGPRFMNWTLGQGGGGAIDLVMHLFGLGFGQALEWLERHFAALPFTPPPTSSAPRPTLTLPPPHPDNFAQVRRYLVGQRRLPAAIFEPLLASGDLYADLRANAVFLLREPQGRPVGAELRGTTAHPWRGMAPGSRKDHGYFAAPATSPTTAPTAIVLCESAIDALSCQALHPEYHCVSTAGARPNPAWLAVLVAQADFLYCGFDLDPTGEAMAQAMIALHPSIRRLRPSRKDWNDVLRLGP
jgi:hypothetical protein